MKKILFIASVVAALANPAKAQTVTITELPTNIRFEQYTGNLGSIYFWRLPSPGSSVFPQTTCTKLMIPGEKPEQSSRFMALYLFAKNSNKTIFYKFLPTNCQIVSFGMDG